MRKKLLTILTLIMIATLFLFAVGCGNVKFKLNFMVDGEVYATVKTNGKSSVEMPENPEKEGYTFEGWYWDEGVWEKPFTAVSLLNVPLSSDMSVYAKFKSTEHEHEYEDITISSTCEAKGYTLHICKCGERYEDNFVDEVGHSYGEWVSNENGTHSRVCTKDATHIETENCSGGSATCSSFATCSFCNTTYGTSSSHSFTNYVFNNDATCVADGTETATCDYCPETDTRTKVGTVGHSFTNYVYNNDATCTAQGTETATCDNCTETDTRPCVGIVGHSFTNYVYNDDATCTDDGTETATCDYCKETDTRTVEDSALGHSFTNYVLDNNATDDEDGTKTAVCDRDGCDAVDTIAADGSKLSVTLTIVYGNGEANLVITQRKGTDVESISEPQREGFAFMGWDKEIPTVMPDEDMTITAKWNAIFEHMDNVILGLTDYGKTLKEITIPNKLDWDEEITYIFSDAFKNNNVLEKVNFNDKITTIESGAFYNCTALKSITIPNSVKIIEVEAFYNCTSLKTVVIGNGVTYIEFNAFENCTALETVQFGGGLIEISDYAFQNCSSIKTLEFNNGLKEIGISAFKDCTSLASVTLPESLETIWIDAFYGCINLKTVVNNSKHIELEMGSESHGHVAYYATKLNGETSDYEVIATPVDYDKSAGTFRTTLFNGQTINNILWIDDVSAKVYTDNAVYLLQNIIIVDCFLSTPDEVVDYFMNTENWDYSDKSYYNSRVAVVVNDIDMEGELLYNYTSVYFSGCFDGRGHVVSNVTVDTKDEAHSSNSTYGLFGSILATGVIKNIAFNDIKSVDYYVNGAILGYDFKGLMENVYLSYSVDNKSNSGLFVTAEKGIMRNMVIVDNYYDPSFDINEYVIANNTAWGVSPIARALSDKSTTFENVQVISRRPINYHSTSTNQDVIYYEPQAEDDPNTSRDETQPAMSWGARFAYAENETDVWYDFEYFYREVGPNEYGYPLGLGLAEGTATVQNTSETGKTIVKQGIRRYDDMAALMADENNSYNRDILINSGFWKIADGDIVWSNDENISAPCLLYVNEVDYDASTGILYTTAWNGETINKITINGVTLTAEENGGLVLDDQNNIIGIRAKVNANDDVIGIEYRDNKSGSSNVIEYNGDIRIYTDSGSYRIYNVNYYTQLIFDVTDLREAVGYNVDYAAVDLGTADVETDREKTLNGKGFFVATTRTEIKNSGVTVGYNYYEGVYNAGIYKMMNSVDMEKAGIGYTNNELVSGSKIGGFVGYFDGNGYTIDNYAADKQGVFGRVGTYVAGNTVSGNAVTAGQRYVNYNPVIKNLAITDVITSYYDEANFLATPILANLLGTDSYAATPNTTTVENLYVTVSTTDSTAAGSLVVHLGGHTKMNNVYIVNQNEFNMIEVDGLVYTMTGDGNRPTVANGTKVWNVMKNFKDAREGVLFGWAYSTLGFTPGNDNVATGTLDNTTNVYVVSTMPVNFSSRSSLFIYPYAASYTGIKFSAENGIEFSTDNFYKLGKINDAATNVYVAVGYASNEEVGNILIPYGFKQSAIDDAKYLLSSTEAGGLGLTTVGSYGGTAFMCNKCGEVAFSVTDRKIEKNNTCISTAECDGKYVSVDNYKVKNSANRTGTGSFASPCMYTFTVHTQADMGEYYSHENGAYRLAGVYKYADAQAMKKANNDYSSFTGESGNGLWEVVSGELKWVGHAA